MDLFAPDPEANLLPYDGTANYYGRIMSQAQADHFRDALLHDVPWRNDEAIIFGKHIITARKVAWYGDAGFSYTYSGVTRHAIPWNKALLELKAMVEARCSARFNSCLLNLYHNGSEGMAWHSDDEQTLTKNGTIASISFGAERRFCFKHKRLAAKAEQLLEHGSLLVMKGTTQTNWLHRLPPTTKINELRINLTFRQIIMG